jgi:hypothetical protein
MQWTISNGIVVAILSVLGALMLLEVFRFIRDQLRSYFTRDLRPLPPASSDPDLLDEDDRAAHGRRTGGGGKQRRPRAVVDSEYE